ncbi:MAG: YihY/virulence factor BrkB family protein, partial [Candidatus Zixiibacteriota bacterium]
MSLLSQIAKFTSSSSFLVLKKKFAFYKTWLKETFLHTFYKDNCSLMAAAISFYAILSFIPLFLVFISAAGFVLHSSEQALGAVTMLLIKTFPTSTTAVFKILSDLIQRKTVFGLIGLAGLIWAASRIFSAVENAMNIVWKVKKGRAYWHSKFLSLLLVPIVVLIMFSSLAFTAFYTVARNLTIPLIDLKISEATLMSRLFAVLFPIVLGFILFFLIYKIIPYRKVHTKAALIGAIFSGVMWEAAKLLFDLYIKNYAHYQRIYGSLGTLVVMLIWIYYSAFIILIGAEIGSNYEE